MYMQQGKKYGDSFAENAKKNNKQLSRQIFKKGILLGKRSFSNI